MGEAQPGPGRHAPGRPQLAPCPKGLATAHGLWGDSNTNNPCSLVPVGSNPTNADVAATSTLPNMLMCAQRPPGSLTRCSARRRLGPHASGREVGAGCGGAEQPPPAAPQCPAPARLSSAPSSRGQRTACHAAAARQTGGSAAGAPGPRPVPAPAPPVRIPRQEAGRQQAEPATPVVLSMA